jgi:phytochelatin synthase
VANEMGFSINLRCENVKHHAFRSKVETGNRRQKFRLRTQHWHSQCRTLTRIQAEYSAGSSWYRSRRMKSKTKVWTAVLAAAMVSIALAVGGVGVVSRTKVSPDAIASSVIHADDAVERAWNLPAAASFRHEVSWQSNASLCGPSSLANVFRSLGEDATSEKSVLAGTGLCWTGFCIMGLTLDELAGLARAKARRSVTILRNMSTEQFREHLKRSNDPAQRYIINFDRKMIFGLGWPSFSR